MGSPSIAQHHHCLCHLKLDHLNHRLQVRKAFLFSDISKTPIHTLQIELLNSVCEGITVVFFLFFCFFQKWQRRFFILYEHGLLRYALDEMVSEIFSPVTSFFVSFFLSSINFKLKDGNWTMPLHFILYLFFNSAQFLTCKWLFKELFLWKH